MRKVKGLAVILILLITQVTGIVSWAAEIGTDSLNKQENVEARLVLTKGTQLVKSNKREELDRRENVGKQYQSTQKHESATTMVASFDNEAIMVQSKKNELPQGSSLIKLGLMTIFSSVYIRRRKMNK